ncbi:hypothetical protein AB833_08025 [Chromatiales bacterium (ex Bugula neritina AB1)]|nr:hypothetical protein AB833_08025 [Chromatiales bacterium (ex Bugula neritina AB1)]
MDEMKVDDQTRCVSALEQELSELRHTLQVIKSRLQSPTGEAHCVQLVQVYKTLRHTIDSLHSSIDQRHDIPEE